MEKHEWEHCICSWSGSEGAERPCGCGEEEVRLYRDTVVHWQDKHWRIGCAFKAAVAHLSALEPVAEREK